jgi:AcrR family transcriptional regulator
MPSRRYEQGLRAEAAEETRRRILEALYERLRERPSEPVSVEEVAGAARVSRSTIYLIFGSRAGLFDALAAELFRSGEFERVERAVANPDGRESLRGGIRGGAEMYAAHVEVIHALRSMAQLDASAAAGTVQRLEEGRSRGMDDLAQKLAAQDLLRPGLSVDEAAHVLWLVTSFDAFDVLYSGRGLPVDAVVEILTTTAERSLYR